MLTALVSSSTPPTQCEVVRALQRAKVGVNRVGPSEDLDEALGRAGFDLVLIVVPAKESARIHLSEISEDIGACDAPVMVVCDDTSSPALAAFRWIDDFALRPLRADELATRLQRLVRKYGQSSDVLKVGGLALDTKAFEVSIDGRAIGFTYQEFRLLRFLMQHPGEAFSRDQLLARVWSYDYYGGPRTVDIHVRRVRAKLTDAYANCIETVRCVGYRWCPGPLETP